LAEVSFAGRAPRRHSFVSRTVHLSSVTFRKALRRRTATVSRRVDRFIAIVVFGLLHTVDAAGGRSSLR
jgi:hypothetical protein